MDSHPGKPPMTKQDVNIPVGTNIELEACGVTNPRVYKASVIGFVPKKSLMVTIPHCDGMPFSPKEAEEYIVRYTEAGSGYAFKAKVLRLCAEPFPYVHLSFPADVQGALVRNAPRIPVKMPVILLSAGDETGQKRSVAMVDISIAGARLVAFERLGSIGDRFSIEMMAPSSNTQSERYVLPVVIRYIREDMSKDVRPHRNIHHGVEFINLTTSVERFINNFVSDQIHQHRGS